MHPNAIYPKISEEIAASEARANARLDSVDMRLEILGAKLDRVLNLLEKPLKKSARPMPDEANAHDGSLDH
jgi:hypothetical protein